MDPIVPPAPLPSPRTTDGGTSREEGGAPDVPAGTSAVAAMGENDLSRWKDYARERLTGKGVSFLATLAEEIDDRRRFRFGAKVGEGGTAVVQTLVLRDPQERRSAFKYTEGRGLVMKRVAEVKLMCGWIQIVPLIRGMALTHS